MIPLWRFARNRYARRVYDTLQGVGLTGSMSPFGAGPLIGASVVAGAGAATVYAAVVGFTSRPVRNFVALSTGVFAVMLVPVFVAPLGG